MMYAKVKRTLAFSLMIVLALGLVPHIAYAGETGLAAATIETAQTKDAGKKTAAPDASLTYWVADAYTRSASQSDGACAKLSTGNEITAMRIKVSSELKGTIQYQMYLKGHGWQERRIGNAAAGTAGRGALPASAVRIALTGDLSKWYDVKYRVMNTNGKMQPWKANGQIAGTYTSKVGGLEVKLVAKKAKASKAKAGIVGVRYCVKLAGESWQEWKMNNARAGKASSAKRVKNFNANVDLGGYTGGIKYRVRLSDGTWQPWKANGKSIGSYRNIEAFQVKLTGAIAKDYDVVYQTYAAGVGWQGRVRNGMTAGTSRGRRIGAIRIELVEQSKRTGWLGKGTTWNYYRNGKLVKGKWVTTSESPINVMTTKTKRYWIDANGKLAVGRIVDPSKRADSKAGYAAYATRWGYPLKSSKQKTSSGFLLADAKGRLIASKGWLKTSVYDGDKQWYYLRSKGTYSTATTGFFKIGSKRYYGIPEEGYVLRDDIMYISGKWYTANARGVITAASTTAKRIESYVQWAIGIAEDSSHGYTQDLEGRWGPDYDCSSLVISALENNGFNVGGAVYTGNMRSELTNHGFRWHTDLSKIKRGDILLVHSSSRQHTEIYLGKGKTVGAHIAETGGVYGITGDQTGHEIDVGPYYKIWQGYLRFGS